MDADDKSLLVWDLNPSVDVECTPVMVNDTLTPPPRPTPTAYPIHFSYPLTAIASHPSSSKEFLIADSHGSIFLTNWRVDGEQSWGSRSSVELIEPQAAADTLSGRMISGRGSIGWRRDAANM